MGTKKTDGTKKRKQAGGDKPDELSLLVDEVKIGIYTVKPWTLGQIFQLAPVWDKIFTRAKQSGFQFSGDNVGELLLLINPDIIEILKITLGISEDEIKAMPGPEGMTIILAIVNKNFAYLKNSFGPLLKLTRILKIASR